MARHTALLAGLVLAVFLGLFVWDQWGEFSSLGQTLAGASPFWLAAAVALQAGLVGTTALGYRVILDRLGHRVGWWSLLGIYLRADAASLLIPIGEPAAAVTIVQGLGEHGVPRDDAFLAWSIADVVGFAGMFALLLPTVGLLAVEGRLPTAVLLGAIVMAVVLGLVAGALAIVIHGGRLAGPLDRLLPGRLDAFIGRARRHRIGARALLPAFALSVLGEVGSVVVLALVLRAVGAGWVRPSVPLIAYEVGSTAKMLSPVYHGVGAVELSTTATLHRQHVPPAAALAATLVFRALALWLPIVAGVGWHGGARLLGRRRAAMPPESS